MSGESEALNSQVTEAVAAVRRGLDDDWGAVGRSMTVTRHGCAIALQDAVDHLRHIETLATAATARALAQMANGDRVDASEKVLQEARDSVKAARENLSEVVTKLGSWLTSETANASGPRPENAP
jgi:hypothetical protein